MNLTKTRVRASRDPISLRDYCPRDGVDWVPVDARKGATRKINLRAKNRLEMEPLKNYKEGINLEHTSLTRKKYNEDQMVSNRNLAGN
jgi:hypothetical protein